MSLLIKKSVVAQCRIFLQCPYIDLYKFSESSGGFFVAAASRTADRKLSKSAKSDKHQEGKHRRINRDWVEELKRKQLDVLSLSLD